MFRKLSAKAYWMAAWTAPTQSQDPSEYSRLWCWLFFVDQKLKTRTRSRGRGSTTILFSFREEQSGVQRNQLVREIWSYFRAHKVPIQRLLWHFPEMQTHSTAPAHSLLWKHLQSPYPCTKAWQQYFFLHQKKKNQNFVIEKLRYGLNCVPFSKSYTEFLTSNPLKGENIWR